MRGDGQSYTMGYDAYRNLTSVKVGSQNLVIYDYKSGGNRLKSMTYANGTVQNLIYDRFGNVIGEAWNGVMAYRYFYDASNQLVKTLDISNKKMYNINMKTKVEGRIQITQSKLQDYFKSFFTQLA